MEKLFFDLSKSEFSNSRKVLVWIFSIVFFLAGFGIIFMNTVLHDKSIHITFCIAPFGIGIFTAAVAYMASAKKKDYYFVIDENKVEYRFGLMNPVKSVHNWSDVKKIVMPHKEKKVILVYNDNSEHIINLNWLDRKKSHFIRRHFYYVSKEKNIEIVTPKHQPGH